MTDSDRVLYKDALKIQGNDIAAYITLINMAETQECKSKIHELLNKIFKS